MLNITGEIICANNTRILVLLNFICFQALAVLHTYHSSLKINLWHLSSSRTFKNMKPIILGVLWGLLLLLHRICTLLRHCPRKFHLFLKMFQSSQPVIGIGWARTIPFLRGGGIEVFLSPPPQLPTLNLITLPWAQVLGCTFVHGVVSLRCHLPGDPFLCALVTQEMSADLEKIACVLLWTTVFPVPKFLSLV